MSIYTLPDIETYNNLVSNNRDKLIVIDFTAKWCGPCKRIAPMYSQLSKSMPNVIFCKCDVNDNEELTKMFNIKSMPTFIYIRDGKVITSVLGADITRVYNTCQQFQHQRRQ